MAGFELLADVFLTYLRTDPSLGTHSSNIVYRIVSSPLYEPISKLLNANLQFQAYIGTVTQSIAKREILKLISNIALRLSNKIMDLLQIESFNMVAIDKEHEQDMPFLQSLLCVIVNSCGGVILEDFNDSDK